ETRLPRRRVAPRNRRHDTRNQAKIPALPACPGCSRRRRVDGSRHCRRLTPPCTLRRAGPHRNSSNTIGTHMAQTAATMGKPPHGHRKGPGNDPAINAWHWIDGKWVDGNPALMNIWSHAIWMGAAVFDGGRAFEGVTPDLDLHCQRGVRSAELLGLRSPLRWEEIHELALEGVAKFPSGTPLYIRPFMWSEDGFIEPDPASTRIAISVVEAPLTQP